MLQTSSLPSPKQLIKEIPISLKTKDFIKNSRCKIQKIIDGLSQQFLIVVGPCSIHDTKAIKEYATKLKSLIKHVDNSFQLVLRVYCEKPRTATGWKGFLYDPFLDQSNNIKTGLYETRKLLKSLAELEIPTATEFLDPFITPYLQDLISWGCIGARTVSSQTHRQMASGLPMPTGLKNNTDGNIDVAINAAIACRSPHTFIGSNVDGLSSIIKTNGNPYTHIVLRGGDNTPNYYPESVTLAQKKLQQAGLSPRLMIDCSHDNSGKKHMQQVEVFQSVIQNSLVPDSGIFGMILESHLNEGKQYLQGSPQDLQYGVSITDSCLNWESTKNLILWAQKHIKESVELSIESVKK